MSARKVIAEDLVGAWISLGREVTAPDGSKKLFGPEEAPGHLIYTADGFMAALTTGHAGVPDREVGTLTIAEMAAAAAGCVAYFGRYEVKDGTVLHHVTTALFPAWVGKTRLRAAMLDGDRLTYTLAPETDGTVTRILWQRMR
jgi:Lipocalin-like domain